MAEKIEVTTNPKDLIKTVEMGWNLIEGAKKRDMSLTAALEELDPTPREVLEAGGMDAFQRQLAFRGIHTQNLPDKGIYASKGELFFQSNMPESRVLFPEFIDRTIRAAMMDQTDYLSYLVGDNWEYGNVFRHFYLDDTQIGRSSGRKAEGAGGPKVKVSWSEKQVTLKDFGIQIDMTYDFVKWASLPMIQTVLSRVALQRRLDEASEAIAVLISGDGYSKEGSAAANTNLSTYQTTHTKMKDLLYDSYLKWIGNFFPYQASTIVGTLNGIVDFLTMAKPAVDPAFMYSLLDKSFSGGTPKIANLNFGGITALQHPDIGNDDLLLALDNRFALMGYRETGADLVETDRLITTKFERIVISNRVYFAKVLATASRTLTADA